MQFKGVPHSRAGGHHQGKVGPRDGGTSMHRCVPNRVVFFFGLESVSSRVGQEGNSGGWGVGGFYPRRAFFFVGSKNGPKSINIDNVLICEVRGSASNVATG